MRRRRISLAAVVALLPAVLAACTFVESLDYLQEGADTIDGGGTDAITADRAVDVAQSPPPDTGGPLVPPEAGADADAESDADAGPISLVETLAADQSQPRYLKQDADRLFWFNVGTNTVMQIRKDMVAPATGLATIAGGITALAPDLVPGGRVYWTAGGRIGRVLKEPDAGAPELLPYDPKQALTAIAVSPDNLFVAALSEQSGYGSLIRVTLAGTNPIDLAPESLDERPVAIAYQASTTRVVWSENELEYIYSLPANAPNGDQRRVHGGDEVVTQRPLDNFAVDDAAIYWGYDRAGEATLETVSTTPGADIEDVYVFGNEEGPAAIAVDADAVWYVTRTEGAVYRVTKIGAQRTRHAAGLARPTAIAVDAAYVYVTVQGTSTTDGRIVRIKK